MATVTQYVGLSSLFLGCSGIPFIGKGYIDSQEPFHKYLKGICLPAEIEGDWKIAQDKLTQHNGDHLSSDFSQLKKKLSSTTSDTGEYLKNLCIDVYSRIYKSWFFKKDTLMNDLKAFCALQIEDKLTKAKIFNTSTEEDKEAIKNKVNSLQQHNEDKGTLDDTLKTIKDGNNAENNWEKLRGWCSEKYKAAYLGESTNEYKLAKEYCQKP